MASGVCIDSHSGIQTRFYHTSHRLFTALDISFSAVASPLIYAPFEPVERDDAKSIRV